MRVYLVVVQLFVIAASCAGALACRKVVEKIGRKAVEIASEPSTDVRPVGPVKLDVDEQQASITSNDGKERTAVGQGLKVPADFPRQVPIYPGANVTASHVDTSGAPKYLIAYAATGPADKVLTFYKNELKKFRIEQESSAEAAHVMVFVDAVENKLRVQVVVSKGAGGGSSVIVNTEALP